MRESRIARYHRLKEAYNDMAQFFAWLEMNKWDECKFYEYDAESCENYCHNPLIKRKDDFFPQNECWKCKEREEKEIEDE